MPLKVPYGASIEFLEALRLNLLQGAALHAYTTNYTPTNADVAATYLAMEASFGGYSPITLNSWGASFLNGANQAETDEAIRTWSATGSGLPVTIYGIFVLSNSGDLLYAELNPLGGITLVNPGDAFSYQPVFTDESKF